MGLCERLGLGLLGTWGLGARAGTSGCGCRGAAGGLDLRLVEDGRLVERCLGIGVVVWIFLLLLWIYYIVNRRRL